MLLRALPALLSFLLLGSGCASFLDRGVAPRTNIDPNARDPLQEWDPEVVALFIQAQMMLRSREPTHTAAERSELAADLLTKAIGRDPRRAALWRYLGEAWASRPDYTRAVEATARAVSLDPNDAEAQYLLGQQLHRLGRADEAVPHLRVAIALGVPGDEPHMPHYFLYAALRDLTLHDEALAALDGWAAALPADRHPPALRARLLWEIGRPHEAADAALEALHLDAQDDEVLSILMRYHRLDPTGAAGALEGLLAADWSAANLHRRLVDVYEAMGRHDRALDHLSHVEILERHGDEDTRADRARLLLAAHRAAEARELLEPTVAALGETLSSEETQLVLLLADALVALNEPTAAVARLEAVQPGQPGWLDAAIQRLRVQRERAEILAALQTLVHAETAVPPADLEGRTRLLVESVALHVQVQDWPAAERSLRRLDRLAPRRSLWSRVDAFRAQDRRDEGLALVSDALEKTPDDPGLVALQADLLAELGRFAEASAVLDAAEDALLARWDRQIETASASHRFGLEQEREQDLVFLWLRRSHVEHRAGDLAGGEATLRRVLDRQPANPDALNSLAYLLAALGPADRLAEAEALLRLALDQRPFSAAFHDSLGLVLLRQGKVDDALVHLRNADAWQPGNAEIQEHLADALRAAGDAERALAAYRQVLESSDQSDPAERTIDARVRDKIRELQATGQRKR